MGCRGGMGCCGECGECAVGRGDWYGFYLRVVGQMKMGEGAFLDEISPVFSFSFLFRFRELPLMVW